MTKTCESDMQAEERRSRMSGIFEYNPICGSNVRKIRRKT